jgi:hypothetical protein
MQHIGYCRRTPSLVRLMAVILLYACASYGASAVLSGIELVGSSKGLALTLKADAPFTLTTEQKSSAKNSGQLQLTVHCTGAIYGLEDFEFTAFPAACPLKRISVTENAANNSIDLLFVFSKKLDNPVASKQKGPKWLVLLSRAATDEFTWSVQPQVKSVPAVQKQPAAQEQPGTTRLTDVTVLHRDNVKLLTFMFNGPTTMRLKRGQEKIMVLFVNTTNGLSSSRFSPPGDSQTVIELKQVLHGGTVWLGAAVTLRKDALEGALMQAFSDKLAIYSPDDTLQGLSFWSAASGKGMAYPFASIPRFAVDYDGMKKKALSDMSNDAAMGKTFAVREGEPKKMSQSPPAAQAAAVPEQEIPAPAGPAPLPGAKAGTAPVRLLMAKNDVTVRAEPVSSGKAMAKLPLGTVATQIEKKGAWVKILTPEVAGWVTSAMTVDSAKASRALFQVIEKFNQQRLAQQKAAEEKAARESAAKEKAEQAKIEKEKLAQERDAQKKAALDAKMAKKKAATEAKQAAGDSSLRVAAAVPESLQTEKNINSKKQVEYHTYGRDPFLPLSRDEDSPVANVDNLKLVGILYDESDRIALFEDVGGKARALMENDPVQNGYVLRVQPDKVLFLLNDLGISRTYAMKLSKENEK